MVEQDKKKPELLKVVLDVKESEPALKFELAEFRSFCEELEVKREGGGNAWEGGIPHQIPRPKKEEKEEEEEEEEFSGSCVNYFLSSKSLDSRIDMDDRDDLSVGSGEKDTK